MSEATFFLDQAVEVLQQHSAHTCADAVTSLRAEVARLTAELAEARHQCQVANQEHFDMEQELEELRAQEPVGYVREFEGDESDLGNMLFESDKNELDDNKNWQPVFSRPVPAK